MLADALLEIKYTLLSACFVGASVLQQRGGNTDYSTAYY
jgi:hypothetical protein